MKMENVLLIGIGGVYNYGCEAIVRGTVNILKNANPKVKLSYASYNYEDDVKRLTDCDIQIIHRRKRGRWNPNNVLRKLLSFVGISYSLPYDSSDWLNDYDTVFSIGGDIYTLAHDGSYNVSLPLFLEKCQKRGMKYVLWGASVGKFNKNKKASLFYQKHLEKIDLLFVREKNTLNYLSEMKICNKMYLGPDPAFFVAPDIYKTDQKKNNVIGINLSPLSALYQYGNIDVAIKLQAYSIMRLIDIRACEILFLPHVLGNEYGDNDLLYMRDIYDSLDEKYKKSVIIVDNDPGFIGLKHEIMKCDIVIAARMHCAVNAISTGVPALFLSYSEKAKGMAEYVYSSTTAVISLTDFEDALSLSNRLDKWHLNFDVNILRKYDFNEILQ